MKLPSLSTFCVMDSFIAVTTKTYELVFITRNVKDMEKCQARHCNPWI
jgi:hypothetical protein